mgnify:CR=1 FL=1
MDRIAATNAGDEAEAGAFPETNPCDSGRPPVVHVIVITMKTLTGEKRMGVFEENLLKAAKLSEQPYKLHIVWGVLEKPYPWVLDNMRKYPKNPKKRASVTGCYCAHVNALTLAATLEGPCIICEDDAQCTNLFVPKADGGPVLMGGLFCHPKNWARDRAFKLHQVPLILNTFVPGVNRLNYDLWRWHCAVAICYPMRSDVVSMLKYLTQTTGKKFTHVDLVMCRSGLVKRLIWPSAFTHDDKGKSQNGLPSCYNSRGKVIRNYQVVPQKTTKRKKLGPFSPLSPEHSSTPSNCSRRRKRK